MNSPTSKKKAANERIAKEQEAIQKKGTISANLAAAMTQLQASVAKLAEEITASSAMADPFRECES